MEKLIIDTGIKEFEVNGKEVLKFNPTDPNVYNRFYDAVDNIEKMDEEFTAATKDIQSRVDEKGLPVDAGKEAIQLMHNYDACIKEKLACVFGKENDFDKIMDGVNLMAIGRNGERIVTNLFAALTPIIEAGTKQHLQEKVSDAVMKAKANRAQRRAAVK